MQAGPRGLFLIIVNYIKYKLGRPLIVVVFNFRSVDFWKTIRNGTL